VAGLIADKMLRRHPHVFGEEEQREAAAHSASWEAQKSTERKARGQRGALAGVPIAHPALTRAEKLTKRAARVGFDWPSVKEVLEKLQEETEELKAELDHADRARLQDELGDMLFVMANLARKLDLDPETCLRGANEKFTQRFEGVERILAQNGLTPQDATLEMMEEAWIEVKKR